VGNVSTVPVSLHIPLVLAACSRGLPANRQLHSTIPRETQTDTHLPDDVFIINDGFTILKLPVTGI
jgi:hypothetical protein